jgi:uncharacterized membrane-anchored protein
MEMFALIWRMLRYSILLLITTALAAQEGQNPAAPQVNWQAGPGKGSLGEVAEITIPYGYSFLKGDDTRKMMEYMGNPPSNRELGMLINNNHNWFMVFEFDEIGYVKDDEKDQLDADALLKSIKEGTAAGNQWRKEHGQAALEVVGWQKKPAYNDKTNNLEWATLLSSQGRQVINHNIRLLGRKGVMEVTLVLGQQEVQTAMPMMNTALGGFAFNQGERYSEFREGDKIAAYGLGALVLGGAAAVAAKSGLLGKLWKFILIGIIALGGIFRKFWNKIRGVSTVETRPPEPPAQV